MSEICPEEQDCVDTSLPSVMEMAKNLMNDGTQIISNALKGNETLATEEVKNMRWSTCTSCPMLTDNRCVKCGCFMKVKVAFKTSKCPMDKW